MPESPGLTLRRTHAGIGAVLGHGVRAARVVGGGLLLAVGVVLAVPGVPGPGVLLVVAGLGVLGGEYEWAQRLNLRLRDSFNRLWGRSR
jgi:hypothetical protein